MCLNVFRPIVNSTVGVDALDAEMSSEELEITLKCRKVLLQAGADPTIHSDPFEYAGNLVCKLASHGTQVSLRSTGGN